ncbi:uncharacterized protein LOC144343271, partial [Saccoglossus kowalevskii]
PPKPGECPHNTQHLQAVYVRHLCRHDHVCPHSEKCCPTVGGNRCLPAVPSAAVTVVTNVFTTGTQNMVRVKRDTDVTIGEIDKGAQRTHLCSNFKCEDDEICRVSTITGQAECTQMLQCADNEDSFLCGSDDNTYRTFCDLKKKQSVRLKHLGKCLVDLLKTRFSEKGYVEAFKRKHNKVPLLISRTR